MASRRTSSRPPPRPPRRRWWWLALLAVVLLVVLVARVAGRQQQPVSANSGAAHGQTVDDIPCATMEQVSYLVHAHLAIFVTGQTQVVPYGIGIVGPWKVQQSAEGPFVTAGSCFYWLHTHTADGIIHIEAPTPQSFTLGQFFDVWGQPLGPTQVGSARGPVIATVNGQRFSGNPRAIPLGNHDLIQLDVGQEVPPQPFTFPSGL